MRVDCVLEALDESYVWRMDIMNSSYADKYGTMAVAVDDSMCDDSFDSGVGTGY